MPQGDYVDKRIMPTGRLKMQKEECETSWTPLTENGDYLTGKKRATKQDSGSITELKEKQTHFMRFPSG